MFVSPARALLARYRGGVTAAAGVVLLTVFGLLEPLEHWSLSRLFDLRGPRLPVMPIVIVGIDEPSLSALEQSRPLPHAMHARLIHTLAAAQPLAIGLAVVLDSPSARTASDDAALGEALQRAGNVVLGASVAPSAEGGGAVIGPAPPLQRAAASVGIVDLAPDGDGTVRRVRPFVGAGSEAIPGIDTALYRVATASGLKAAPLPAEDEILINYSGPPGTFPRVPYHRVVRGEVPYESLRGKILLVGPTAPPMHDAFPTAFTDGDELMPGVEIHANVLETFLLGTHVRELPRLASAVVALVAALGAAALALRWGALRAGAAVALLVVVVGVLAFLSFVYAEVWMRGTTAALALGLGYGAAVADLVVRGQRERQRLSPFFSAPTLRRLERRGGEGGLGVHRRPVTVLFCDIAGFTALADKLAPTEVAELLHEYLSTVTEAIFAHGGTVDTYAGDSVVALFNAPLEDRDHALHAMRAALELQERVQRLSARWESRLTTPIRVGIGVNTGEAVVGALGSRQRLAYTAVGDVVDLGRRLKTLTSEYGAAIVVSEPTRRQLGPGILTRELGQMTLPGRAQPVKVYAVLLADIRRYRRAELDVAATLILLGAGQSCLVATRDVSEGGMALGGVPPSWVPGTRVEIRCEEGRLSRPLLAEGVIAWRRGGEAGITFAGLDTVTGPTVASYVAAQRDR
jgi:adenylate cyclase